MIPKVIHYCWFGRNPIPQKLQRCIDSWKRVMPDYEIRLWNEDNYDITKCAYMKEAYEARKWAFVADYARLDILYKYGGINLDTDVEVLKRFDDLLELEGFCGFELDKKKKVCNVGLGLGCIIGQKMIGIIRNHYHTLHFAKSDSSIDTTPIPVIVTRILSQYGLKVSGERQTVNGLTVFPVEYFCPMNPCTGEFNITPRTYSIHHYSATWLSEADQERRKLRMKYSKFGSLGSEVISSFIAYRKHYGFFGMWKHILEKILTRMKDK